ncbi:hypothetical protein HDA40_003113 [Hamadaea flava]|uniref:Secreted protein n=1 Tax=Hamadaea flava TaxID=1742688 RepID=A0ABV8LYZ0_9ACTN|nr:hypothetical protein [Hamadaea flava]MCP2324606.1 hypothetical protein [Hamadaea flava]
MRLARAVAATALITALGVTAAASPAVAAGQPESPYGDSGWFPTPSEPAEIPGGALCAFPIRIEEPIDGVRGRVIATEPELQEEYLGPLTVKVTNLDTGASATVNASGHGHVVTYHADGSQTWDWSGPVAMGFRPDRANNHAAGLYLLTGRYIAELTPAGRTLSYAKGTEKDICAMIA